MNWMLVCALFSAVAANPEENDSDPDAFEGDMLLTPEQKMAAINGWDVDAPLGRGGMKNRRWPGGVLVYQIDDSLAQNPTATNAIDGAFREWSSKTCITFKKRTNERAYLSFKVGSSCSSMVGYQGISRQPIQLSSLCWHVGIVVHEIGHALGFYHEQSRPDRDKYITIVLDNVHDGFEYNFKKYDRSTIDSLGTPYDYGSIMHYGPKAFSKNRKPTIIPKKSGVTIGQRKGLSPIDAKQMNLMYKEECNGGGGGGGGDGGSSCVDKDPNCKRWLKLNYCTKYKYVKQNCKKTCKEC